MAQTLQPPASTDPLVIELSGDDRVDHGRAVEMLRAGRVREGAHLLGDLARRTTDDVLRSQCLLNLGEILEQLGEADRAYETFYLLAHKPREKRNEFDHWARLRVNRMFEVDGLRRKAPDFPPRVQVEITNRCNLRCIMCTRNQMKRPLGDMSVETFAIVADQVCREATCTLAMYFLGEPLLNPHLEEMVRYVAERADPRLVFGIQTNGMLLNEDRARRLLDAGLRNFWLSLDGLEGDLERVRISATYSVIETNILRLSRLAEEMGLADLRVDISKLCDDPEAEEVKRFRDRWEGKVQAIHLLGITRVEGNSYLAADGSIHDIGPAASARGGYCGQGQRLLVHWSGDYAFCCSDINRGIDLGNVREIAIRDVWHSDRLRQIREQIIRGDYSRLPACQACMAGRR